MRKELYTGAHLLQNPNDEQVYGMAAAFGPPKNEGTVRLFLKGQHITWEIDDDKDLTITLSEPQARQIAEQLIKVAVQLEQLRGLDKLGYLSPKAYPNTDHSDEVS